VSLQRYVFLLMGALILVFSIFQYYFIEQVRIQVNDEITAKTRTLSQVALSAFTESQPFQVAAGSSTLPIAASKLKVNLADVPEYAETVQIRELQVAAQKSGAQIKHTPIIIKIENTPNREVQLDEDLVMLTGDNTKTITVLNNTNKLDFIVRSPLNVAQQDAINELNKIEPRQIKALLVNRVDTSYTVDFDFADKNLNFQKIVSFDNDTSSINRYFTQLRWQLFSFTLIGLVFAFWLAKHISKPLSGLSQGFADLGNGQLGVQLKQSGVKEMRDTISIFNQTSERLSQLHKLEQKYQQQQQMAELGEVARGLAHTLRNPLNTIGLGISQIQQPNISTDEKNALAKQIQDKIMHVDGTIKTLMHLANADVDRSQRLNVVTAVSDIMLEVSVTTQASIQFPMAKSNKPVLLQCAEAEIRAIIHALISNAIEANEGQDKQHSVSVDLQQIEEGICLNIRDHGAGLSAKALMEIFKPHFTTKPEGAGMGLFIVKRISEMYYKGSIVLANHKQGGCVATLTLQDAVNLNEMSDITLNDTAEMPAKATSTTHPNSESMGAKLL
jgi:signal transduction histidine kinase